MLPFTDQSRCCIRSPLTGHSPRVRNLEMSELTDSGDFVEKLLLDLSMIC